jgi:hypothetical protein
VAARTAPASGVPPRGSESRGASRIDDLSGGEGRRASPGDRPGAKAPPAIKAPTPKRPTWRVVYAVILLRTLMSGLDAPQVGRLSTGPWTADVVADRSW